MIEHLDLLYKNIVINNDEILKLPKFSKMACFKLLNDIKTLKNSIYRLSILKNIILKMMLIRSYLKLLNQFLC